VKSNATDVAGYLDELPPDRREAIETIRATVLAHLRPGFEEGVEFGMISWHVPLARYPDTYNGRPLGVAALANQERHMALYLMGVYGDPAEAEWFRQQWTATGKRLDMGKSCVRFRRLEDVPLDVVAAAIERVTVDDLIGLYEASRTRR
jgi:hypothetical protein